MENKKLSVQEIKFILLVSFILIIVTGLSFIFGYFIKGNLIYTGINIFSPIDGPVYYSYIEQIKEGNFLLDNLFSNETGAVKLFNPFWLFVGLIARIFQLSAPGAYHLFRIILTPLFLLVLYKFISFFYPDLTLKRKKLCFLYSIFASGLSSFWLVFNNYPALIQKFSVAMDLWVPESSNFLILFCSPHFLASLTLIILIFYYFFKFNETKKIKYSILAGLLALFLFSFHPFYVLTVYGVLLTYLLVSFIKNKKIAWLSILNYSILVLISLPAVFYYLYLMATNLDLQIKAQQNNCLTPDVLVFLVSYGPGLIMASLAIIYLLKKKSLTEKKLFLIIWFLITIVLIYGPFNFQRRLSEGFQVPLTLLAFMGLLVLYDFFKNKYSIFKDLKMRQFLIFFIIFFCLSNVTAYFFNLKYLSSKPEIVYVRPEIVSALTWYKSQTNLEDAILASPANGNIIPGLIGRRVFLGHDKETINFKAKLVQADWFFSSNQDDKSKKEFLENNHLAYVFYTDNEKKLGDYNPAEKDYLKLVYQDNGVEIYKFNPD